MAPTSCLLTKYDKGAFRLNRFQVLFPKGLLYSSGRLTRLWQRICEYEQAHIKCAMYDSVIALTSWRVFSVFRGDEAVLVFKHRGCDWSEAFAERDCKLSRLSSPISVDSCLENNDFVCQWLSAREVWIQSKAAQA